MVLKRFYVHDNCIFTGKQNNTNHLYEAIVRVFQSVFTPSYKP